MNLKPECQQCRNVWMLSNAEVLLRAVVSTSGKQHVVVVLPKRTT